MSNDRFTIFLVDDDAVFLKSLEIDFKSHGDFNVKTFALGELCVKALDLKPDIIVLDYHLDGIDKSAMNGLQTLDKIKNFNSDIPVIILSSQDKIEVAVNCMRHKAFDYVIKSETAFMRLQKIITNIFRFKKNGKRIKLVH